MSECNNVIGTIALAFDDWMLPDECEAELTRLIGEIDSLQLRAILWILTAFALGSVRRMGYAYTAGRDGALQADPDLARRIHSDNQEIKRLIEQALGDSRKVECEGDVEDIKRIAQKEFEMSDRLCRLVGPSYTATLELLSDEAGRAALDANERIRKALRQGEQRDGHPGPSGAATSEPGPRGGGVNQAEVLSAERRPADQERAAALEAPVTDGPNE